MHDFFVPIHEGTLKKRLERNKEREKQVDLFTVRLEEEHMH